MACLAFTQDTAGDVLGGPRLSSGDSKAAWLRHAVKLRLHADPILDDLYEPEQHEERIEFVTAAVYAKVHEELESALDNGHPQRMEQMLGPDWEATLEKYGIEIPEE